MITRDMLLSEKASLEKQQAEAEASLQAAENAALAAKLQIEAVSGAMQTIDHLLKVCDEKDAENGIASSRPGLEKALKIDGWLSRKEAETLYDYAGKATGPIVEIGSWQGRSTAAIAMGSKAGNRQQVYSVDDYKGVPPGSHPTNFGKTTGWRSSSPEILRQNLNQCGINGEVQIVEKASVVAAKELPNELGMVFIDGDHSYEAVCNDIDAWMPKLKVGGYAIFHDTTAADAGVVTAFKEKIMADPLQWLVIGRTDSAMVVQKINAAETTTGEAVLN